VWLCGCLCAQAGRAGPPRRWPGGDQSAWGAEFEKMKQVQADLLGIKNGPRAKL